MRKTVNLHEWEGKKRQSAESKKQEHSDNADRFEGSGGMKVRTKGREKWGNNQITKGR